MVRQSHIVVSPLPTMSLDTLCAGYLIKEGTKKGHSSISKEKRWFVLKDLFLFYYTEAPKEGKKTNKLLKGIIFLPPCSVMVPSNSDSLLLISPEKEYKLSPASKELQGKDAQRDMERWKNALEYAITRANKFESKIVGGWLMKRGGKGHKVQNSKRRYFVLRGNLLQYYSEPKEKTNDISTLKGYIDIAKIIELEVISGGSSGDHRLRLMTSDYKEFILSAKEEGDRNRWLEGIDNQIKMLEDHEFQVCYNLKESIKRVGKIYRADIYPKPSSAAMNFVALTEVGLRFYAASLDKAAIEKDLAKDVQLVVPLLGAYCGLDNQTNRILLVDNMEDIQSVIVAIAKQYISLGSNLRYSCFAQLGTGTEETAIVIINGEGVIIDLLSSKQKLIITPERFVGLAFANAEAFYLRYFPEDVEVTESTTASIVTFRSTNAAGIYTMVGAAIEALRNDNSLVSRKRFSQKPKPTKGKASKKQMKGDSKKKTNSVLTNPHTAQVPAPMAAPSGLALPSDFDAVMANRKSLAPKLAASTIAQLPPGTVVSGGQSYDSTSSPPPAQPAEILFSSNNNQGESAEASEEESSSSSEEEQEHIADAPPALHVPPMEQDTSDRSMRASVAPGLFQAFAAQAEAEAQAQEQYEQMEQIEQMEGSHIPEPALLSVETAAAPTEGESDDSSDQDEDSSSGTSDAEEDQPQFGEGSPDMPPPPADD